MLWAVPWPIIISWKFHWKPFITFWVYFLTIRQTDKEAQRVLVLSQDYYILRDGHSIQDIITYKMDSFLSLVVIISVPHHWWLQFGSWLFLFILEPCDQYTVFPLNICCQVSVCSFTHLSGSYNSLLFSVHLQATELTIWPQGKVHTLIPRRDVKTSHTSRPLDLSSGLNIDLKQRPLIEVVAYIFDP